MKKILVSGVSALIFIASFLTSCDLTGSNINKPTDPSVNGNPNIIVAPTTINSNVIWDSSKTYYIKNSVTIDTNGTLTIPEGTVVKFGSSMGLKLKGTLNAQGAFFTSYRNNEIGETIASGIPSPNDWGGISVSTGQAVFNNCTFSYAGGSSSSPKPALKAGASGNVVVENCTFSYNGGKDAVGGTAALEIESPYNEETNHVKNCTFTNNLWPLSVSAEYTLDASNTFNENKYQGIIIDDSNVESSSVWPHQSIPYFIKTTLVIKSTLTIGAGTESEPTEIKVNASKYIYFSTGGTLNTGNYTNYSAWDNAWSGIYNSRETWTDGKTHKVYYTSNSDINISITGASYEASYTLPISSSVSYE